MVAVAVADVVADVGFGRDRDAVVVADVADADDVIGC